MTSRTIDDFERADWALIATALAQWAGNPQQLDVTSQRHAYRLIDEIAGELDCLPQELVEGTYPDDPSCLHE